MRKCGRLERISPGIAAQIEPGAKLVLAQVEYIGGAGTVDVGQMEVGGVEGVDGVEQGCIGHVNLGAKHPKAQVGPVGDLGVPDANDVGETVARHICEKDALYGVG